MVAVEAGSMEEEGVGLTVGKVTTMDPCRRVARGAVGEIHSNSFRSVLGTDDNRE